MKKQCSKCKRELPATTEYFYRDKRNNDGLRSQCKKCNDKYYQKHKKQRREYRRKHKKENKGCVRKYRQTIKGYLVQVYGNMNCRCSGKSKNPKHTAYIKRGIKNKFNSLDDFRDYVINTLSYTTYGKVKGLQIDRIDNNGHYERGNIRFVTPKQNSNNRG